MDDKMIQQIREGLREHYGSLEKVVTKTTQIRPQGYSRRYVQYVLEGTRKNIEVLNVAAEVLADYRKRYVEQAARLKITMTEVNAYA